MRLPIFSVLLISLFTQVDLPAQQTGTPEHKVVTGIVLLNDRTAVDFKTVLQALKTEWGIRVDSFNQAEKTLILHTSDATVMLANMDYPVAPAEIQMAAEGAWLWKTAAAEAPRHQSQVVISAIGVPSRPIELYKIFTRIAAAVLDNTRACGIYMNSQYLLQSKAFYLQAARNLDQDVLPIYCWIYFGMLQQEGLSSGYTFGLTEFGLTDLEVNKSKHSLQEVHAILYDAAGDALRHKVLLQDGGTIETLEGQKITLRLSKSVLLEGKTLKVDY